MASGPREVEINDKTLRIYEQPALADSEAGATTWDCSLVLAHWFQTASWPPGYWKGKKVVELGSGTGLAGLSLAALGASVKLTDKEALVPGLQRNIEANNLRDTAVAQPLEWGGRTRHISTPVDIILASDVLYDMQNVPALAQTMIDLSSPHTQILLAYELRSGTTNSFKHMKKMGVHFAKVPSEELDPAVRPLVPHRLVAAGADAAWTVLNGRARTLASSEDGLMRKLQLVRSI